MQRKIVGGEITPKRGRGRPKGSLSKAKPLETRSLAKGPESRQPQKPLKTVPPPKTGPVANNPFGALAGIRLVVNNSEELAVAFIKFTKQNASQFANRDYPGAAKSALECANITKQLADIEREIFWLKKAITCYKMVGYKKEIGETSSRLADIYAGLRNHRQAAFYYMQAATNLRAVWKYHEAGENAVNSATQNKIVGNIVWAFNASNLASLCFKDAVEKALEHDVLVQKNRLR